MNVFISYIDTGKLYVQFFRPKYSQISILVQEWVDLYEILPKPFKKLVVMYYQV